MYRSVSFIVTERGKEEGGGGGKNILKTLDAAVYWIKA